MQEAIGKLVLRVLMVGRGSTCSCQPTKLWFHRGMGLKNKEKKDRYGYFLEHIFARFPAILLAYVPGEEDDNQTLKNGCKSSLTFSQYFCAMYLAKFNTSRRRQNCEWINPSCIFCLELKQQFGTFEHYKPRKMSLF